MVPFPPRGQGGRPLRQAELGQPHGVRSAECGVCPAHSCLPYLPHLRVSQFPFLAGAGKRSPLSTETWAAQQEAATHLGSCCPQPLLA